ncbi:hypothetical protein D3C87_1550450 [compost metagenome]
MTTECHSVFDLRSPLLRSRQLSVVAMRRFAIGLPSWVLRISGSAPRLPMRMTLLTLPAIVFALLPLAAALLGRGRAKPFRRRRPN